MPVTAVTTRKAKQCQAFKPDGAIVAAGWIFGVFQGLSGWHRHQPAIAAHLTNNCTIMSENRRSVMPKTKKKPSSRKTASGLRTGLPKTGPLRPA